MNRVRYLLFVCLISSSLGCVASQQATAPPIEQLAWAAYLNGDSNTASTYAGRCIAEKGAAALDCQVLQGVIDSDNAKHEIALQRFGAIHDAVLGRAKRQADSEWNRFVLKSMLKREGLSQYRLGKFDKALGNLVEFNARRNRDETAFDIYSEMLAMSLYNLGQYSRAAEYLEQYLLSPERTSTESYCWVTFNISAINARLSLVEKAVLAARQHLAKCDRKQFESDAKSDADFQPVLRDPRFATLLR